MGLRRDSPNFGALPAGSLGQRPACYRQNAARREVVSRNPDLIVAIGPLITLAVSAATSTVPIVATGTHPMVSP